MLDNMLVKPAPTPVLFAVGSGVVAARKFEVASSFDDACDILNIDVYAVR